MRMRPSQPGPPPERGRVVVVTDSGVLHHPLQVADPAAGCRCGDDRLHQLLRTAQVRQAIDALGKSLMTSSLARLPYCSCRGKALAI
jgi:hypothetical protein